MHTENKIMYIAEDGTHFENKDECLKYEKELEEKNRMTTYWQVITEPDLTEGRGYYKKVLITCYGLEYEDEAKMFVEDWCYRKYGRKVAFIMGSAPIENWRLNRLKDINIVNPKISIGDYSYPAIRINLVLGEKEKGLIEVEN